VENVVPLNGAVPRCRFCGTALGRTVVDLGCTPLANALVACGEAACGEDTCWPLHVRLCEACLLVQVETAVPPDAIFHGSYPYFSSVSATWTDHAARYAAAMTEQLSLSDRSLVVEIASNDGYLLREFAARGAPVLGIEPAANVAAAAVSRGVPTEVAFFGEATASGLAARGVTADLVVANNVLAHVPDIGGFARGVARVLKPEGVASFEFPHVLRLLEGVQFDTIYHEHYSYLSLLVVERVLHAAGLRAFEVEELPTHGGSLRVLSCHCGASRGEAAGLARVRAAERAARLDRLEGYAGFAQRVLAVQQGLRRFLAESRAAGRRVAGYGAAAKGCTLLNTTGVTTADMACVADRSAAKQGRLLPGSRIPIVPPDALLAAPPDDLLILPWNLADEIAAQMAPLRAAGTRMWVPVPEMRAI
jgi:SAM-dependent methyltransferase